RRRRDEVALGLLEAGALGDVAQRPHDAAVRARQPRRRDRQREVAVALHGDLAGERVLEVRQRAVRAVPRAAGGQAARELAGARGAPAAIRRGGVTGWSSGWCSERMISVRNASTAASASAAHVTIAIVAVRERRETRSRASLRRACCAAASAPAARRTSRRSL